MHVDRYFIYVLILLEQLFCRLSHIPNTVLGEADNVRNMHSVGEQSGRYDNKNTVATIVTPMTSSIPKEGQGHFRVVYFYIRSLCYQYSKEVSHNQYCVIIT